MDLVRYEATSVVPAPPSKVFALLAAHLDPNEIRRIHPLILSQSVVGRSGDETVVTREIDARGRRLRSQWKVMLRAPEYHRYEILESAGPWAPGTFVESEYSADAGGTRIRSRGELRITVLPFFLPQGRTIRRVLDGIEREDLAYLAAMP